MRRQRKKVPGERAPREMPGENYKREREREKTEKGHKGVGGG